MMKETATNWVAPKTDFIRWLEELSIRDVPLVGGKTASLGEMVRAFGAKGIRVPPGFGITADAFTALIEQKNLGDRVYGLLQNLDAGDLERLATVGHQVRGLIRATGLPEALQAQIRSAYRELCRRTGTEALDVAVRSSATAEDLPEASFAGQQETFLNVSGEEALLEACLNCFASLFTDRAISYRATRGFSHSQVRLSICVQQMVRADLGASGVIFTLDTESGARNVILVTSAYGLGENIVGGKVNPDEFLVQKDLLGIAPRPIIRRHIGSKAMRMVYSGHGTRTTRNVEVSLADQERPSLSDEDVITLAGWARDIEKHYSGINGRDTPMDIEWARDGRSGNLFVLQARPETVHARAVQAEAFTLEKKSKVLLSGRAVGTRIGTGAVQVIRDARDVGSFVEGSVLVADMTDPDWEPIMKKASAIITNRGGRTCHAAIVSREHGVPCIVGTGTATEDLRTGQEVTVSCAEGEEGLVYEGRLPFSHERIDLKALPRPKTEVMVNLGNPGQALKTSLLPVSGVGLARMEFIISDAVKIHPMALAHLESAGDERKAILDILNRRADDPEGYFVEKLSEGIGLIAGAFHPRPVIVRLSDFKTNEYAKLIGGAGFEPVEENPMIGFRGASRYYDPRYRDGFALECKALKFVREQMGLRNVKLMVPFCRSPEEGRKVLEEMKKNGLTRGEDGLEVYVMCEIPSNVLRASEFLEVFDGFSIGSNDLTQMVLGVDRDSSEISHLFDERDPAVLSMLKMAIQGAKTAGRHVGICGQAPSDYPEMTEFLVREGIDSISVTPDVALKTIQIVVDAEAELEKKAPMIRRAVVPPEARVADMESKLKSLFEGSLIGVIVGDTQGKILEANPAFLKMIGYDEAQVRAGELSWRKLTPPEFAEVTMKQNEYVQRTGKSVLYEKEYLTRDGNRLPVLVGITRYDPVTGECIVFVVDLTPQKMLEKSRHALEETQEEIKRRELYSAIASHELKNPISALAMRLQMLEKALKSCFDLTDEETSGRIHRHLILARESAARAVTLTGRLMDVTAIKAGKMRIERESVELTDVVRQVIEGITDERYRKQDMVLLMAPAPVVAEVDPVRFEQVIVNLIGNAIKFGLGLPISVSVGSKEGQAFVSVCDRGRGVPASDREKIFGEFERAGADHEQVAGLGLGLFITKGIIVAHQGTITVTENQGGGACFNVVLPIHPLELEKDRPMNRGKEREGDLRV